jgi:branched-chain amino acid transport system permease protein
MSARSSTRSRAIEPLIFFLSLLIDGALAGALYALIAVAFVLVYKSSRVVNFALGEWIMTGATLAAVGQNAVGLGLPAAIVFAAAGMAVFGVAFNAIVVRRLLARPAISLIMVTIGLGAMMRGTGTLVFAGIPGGLQLPVLVEPLIVRGVPIPPEKLIAAMVAAIIIALVTLFYQRSRIGVGLRALADDPQAAAAAGIDPRRLFALLWGVTGVISVAAGILWIFAAGGGFGVALVGLKIFPIVIIGGLDSLPGTIVAAMLIGIVESLGAGYLDPQLGGGFGTIASYLLMMAMLMVRPYGLFGQAPSERV